MDLLTKLRRLASGKCDPVSVLQDLSALPSVTFVEYLSYGYLVDEFSRLRDYLNKAEKRKLSVEFSAAGQLWVKWRGLEEDARRMVLISHADREGFLITNLDQAGKTATCWHTSDRAPGNEVIGNKVRLICPDCTMTGTITGIRKLEKGPPDAPYDHAVDIGSLTATTSSKRSTIPHNPYFKGIGYYDIKQFEIDDEGVIDAVSIDNAAGLAILMSLMCSVVQNRWKVNLDCLFTTCEEAGFYGIVREILDGGQLNGDETVCVIVDASSRLKYVPESVKDVTTDSDQAREVGLDEAVVRTADVFSDFDAEVSQLLAVAAENLGAHRSQTKGDESRRKVGISEQERRQLEEDRFPFNPEPISWRPAVGKMIGGWCEATPILLGDQLREALGIKGKWCRPRVGALAVPIANFRNSFRQELTSEKCHAKALVRATQILGEAVRLCHRWPFDAFDGAKAGRCRDEGVLQLLVDWQRDFKLLSTVTEEWVAERARPKSKIHSEKPQGA
jgi:hypothetical protein